MCERKRSLFLILLYRDSLEIETKKKKKNEIMTNHPQDLGFQLTFTIREEDVPKVRLQNDETPRIKIAKYLAAKATWKQRTRRKMRH